MKNTEAMALIKQTEQCFVVWDTALNEVIEVQCIESNPSPEQFMGTLGSTRSVTTNPTKGRFLISAKVTMAALEAEQADTIRIRDRIRIFDSWQRCTNDELIRILERQDFQQPMDSYHGSHVIVRMLYRLRASRLSEGELERLERVARFKNSDQAMQRVFDSLDCYLAGIRRDLARLKRIWMKYSSKTRPAIWWEEFTEVAGDLRSSDAEIIEGLIQTIEQATMFGPKWDAMIALGKIGPPAGQQAAEVIRKVIYDSNPKVSVTRDRVIARIASAESEWRSCPECTNGLIPIVRYGVPSTAECEQCVGLGLVQSYETSSLGIRQI